MMRRPLLLLIPALVLPAPAQDGFSLASAEGGFQLALRPSVETALWSGDLPAAGILDIPDRTFAAARLTLEFDAAAGEHWFFHATSRWDRGFDGGNEPDGEVRLDEIFLRFNPLGDERLRLQAGKFPTVFGAWVNQHDFYDDPFLLPPLPYGQIIGVQERVPAAMAPAAIAARAQGRAVPVSRLSKQNWASPLWGPVYAWGLSVSGSPGRFDYAFEVKSSGLSSHSDQWRNDAGDFSAPAFTARGGFRPDAAWAFGASASRGSYLAEEAGPLLPAGMARRDLAQTSLGVDARWSHRQWILSGEVVASEYETLSAGDLRTLGWFLQARWKAAPGLWLAGRFGLLDSNDAEGPGGKPVRWTDDVRRAEAAAGWRLNAHLLLKASYSYTWSHDESSGSHLTGIGLGFQW